MLSRSGDFPKDPSWFFMIVHLLDMPCFSPNLSEREGKGKEKYIQDCVVDKYSWNLLWFWDVLERFLNSQQLHITNKFIAFGSWAI